MSVANLIKQGIAVDLWEENQNDLMGMAASIQNGAHEFAKKHPSGKYDAGLFVPVGHGPNASVLCFLKGVIEVFPVPIPAVVGTTSSSDPRDQCTAWARANDYLMGFYTYGNDGKNMELAAIKPGGLVTARLVSMQDMANTNAPNNQWTPDIQAHRWAQANGFISAFFTGEQANGFVTLMCFN